MNEPAPERPAWGSRLLLAAALVAAGAAWWQGWDHSLLDRHEFRQAQTALTVQWLGREAGLLAYPLPVFGPPWSAPMEFPLYQWIVALLARLGDWSIEPAGRAVSVALFLLALPALNGLLAALGWSARSRPVVLAAVVLAPVYLFYTRTVLIESTALCLGLWFLLAYQRGLAGGGPWWVGAAALLGALGATVKPTTFLALGPAAAVLVATAAARVVRTGIPGPRSWLPWSLATGLPAVAAFTATWAWTRFADRLKGANPFSEFLVSANMGAWNFGFMADRLDPGRWSAIAANAQMAVIPGIVLVPALALFGFTPREHRRRALALAGAGLCGPLLFPVLYAVHDYYFYAAGVFLAAAVGTVLAGILEQVHLPRTARWSAAVLVLTASFAGWNREYGHLHRAPVRPPPALAEVIRSVVPPEDMVVIAGAHWNPELPYFMERRAIMVANEPADLPAVLDRLQAAAAPRRIAAVVQCEGPQLPAAAERWARERLGIDFAFAAVEATEARLFLAPELLPALQRARTALPAEDLKFNVPQPLTRQPLVEQEFAADVFGETARPAPRRGRSLAGIGTAHLADRTVILAHAPSELEFEPPPGARRISASVGLQEESFQPPRATDGIEVEVLEVRPGGLAKTLHRSLLDPVRVPAHRRPRRIEFQQAEPFIGHIVLRIGPGPSESNAYDWAYWTDVRID